MNIASSILNGLLPPAFLASDIFQSALTHKSYHNENLIPRQHNERLEFLGDAVLNLCVARELYERYPQEDEGFLTKARSNLVNTQTLAEKAKNLELDQHLHVSRSERGDNGVWQPRVLASTLEAVIGALYLSVGIIAVEQFLSEIFKEEFEDREILKSSQSDWKSQLQERLQKEFQKTPSYEVLEISGPDHQRMFRVAVMFDGRTLAEGEGTSRKQAEQQAAKKALELKEFK